MDFSQFANPEELRDWIEEQDEPEDVTEELGELMQSDKLQGKPQLYLVYSALSLMDEFPLGGQIKPELLEKKWDTTDEDGERQTFGFNDEGAVAVASDVKEAFKGLTGATAGGPDKEGDTEVQYDDEGRIIGMEDWWINDDREGRWMVVVDEWPFFNFERQI